VIRAFAIGSLLVVANIGASFADEVKVNQINKSFDPAVVSIKAGDTIDFANADTIAHNVYTRGSPQDFSLGTMKPGADKKVTFSTPGSYDVKCAIHPGMKMTITVQ
jgi:plastocyanin